MNSGKRSMLWGAVMVFLSALAIFFMGAWLFLQGLDALDSGQLAVRYSRGGGVVHLDPARHPIRFAAEVWSRLLLGGLLLVFSIGFPLVVLFSPAAKRMERLRRAAQVRVGRGGRAVPPLAAAPLLLAFVAMLMLIARGSTA
jgi:hypothetical protein